MENIINKEARTSLTPDFDVPLEGLEFPVGGDIIEISQLSLQTEQWHWHEEVEFVLIKEGNVMFQLPDEKFYLSTGDGVFLIPNQLHSIRLVDCDSCSIYVLKFDPAFLFGYGQASLASKYVLPVITSTPVHHLILKKGNPDMDKILDLIYVTLSHFFKKDFGYELKIKGCLCELWSHLLSFFQDTGHPVNVTSQHSKLDSERIKGAILFIQKNYVEPLTLEEIADSIHVSKSECCRCFQRTLGLTAFDYLLKYRIFESTKKIMRGEKVADSIATLAASVGFNNTSYYNKIFKKYLGCTPTEYKKNILNNSKKK